MAYRKVARAGDVLPGQMVFLDVEDEEIVLCNVNGQIWAVANVCSHDGGTLSEGWLLGDQIECPRHGARFDVRTGEVKALPAVAPIPTYSVMVEGEDIYVDVD
jgi:3-phenylpropionate/trans-cinnamate dioxygenase ferredoxin subunit